MRKIYLIAYVVFIFTLSACTITFNPNGNNNDSIDYAQLINTISTHTMRANVEVSSKAYSGALGFETKSRTSQGSGIIFDENDDYFFVLTNHHVVYYDRDEYMHREITLTDYQGTTYSAVVVANTESADYDLAVLRFDKLESTTLISITLATHNPANQQEVISIGRPRGQSNAITFGKVQAYQRITIEDMDSAVVNVAFQVIVHNSPTDSGSSGGALLNTDLELAGLNYAGSYNDDGEFVAGFAIPILRIKEYLDQFEL